MVAATDYMKAFADQIRPFVPRRYRVLGTDGFGRSDYRRKLRAFFEVDRRYVTVAALHSLATDGAVPAAIVADAINAVRHRCRQAEPARGLAKGVPMTTTATEVTVPDIGAFENVPIIELHVKAGDQVNEEDPLITLESDKATMDVPAPVAGQVLDILVKLGDEVSTGSPILTIGAG